MGQHLSFVATISYQPFKDLKNKAKEITYQRMR